MSAIALTCLQIPSSPVKYAITAVIVTALLVSITKLDVFYNPEANKLRDFGTSPGETIFPAWMAMAAAGYLVYVLASAGSAFPKCN
jgi:hypothetical protein